MKNTKNRMIIKIKWMKRRGGELFQKPRRWEKPEKFL